MYQWQFYNSYSNDILQQMPQIYIATTVIQQMVLGQLYNRGMQRQLCNRCDNDNFVTDAATTAIQQV
jgi:predicted oxidoreductase (fatty acid repression mutant protein)